MAAVPIQITGVLWDHADKSGKKVTLMGDASISGLVIGGGPIVPPDTSPPDPGEPPLGIWGPTDPRPTPPIHIPPTPPTDGQPGIPSHPIVLPPVPPDPPIEPPGGAPPPEGWFWHWVPEHHQWVLVYNPPAGTAEPKR